jgi:hypothetical protein
MRAFLLLSLFAPSGLACDAWGGIARPMPTSCRQLKKKTPPNSFLAPVTAATDRKARKLSEFVEHACGFLYSVLQSPSLAAPHKQVDVHYYGVATDVAYLKPFCEQQSKGGMAR